MTTHNLLSLLNSNRTVDAMVDAMLGDALGALRHCRDKRQRDLKGGSSLLLNATIDRLTELREQADRTDR